MNSVRSAQVKVLDTDSRKRPRKQPNPRPNPRSNARTRPSTKLARPESGWFSIRDILDERVQNGRIQYLIDWEGADKHGRPYDPTWEPARNVTEAAINAWRDKKKDAAAKSTPVPGPRNVSSQAESTQNTSTQDSEPIQARDRRRKRKREQRRSGDTPEQSSGGPTHEEEEDVAKRQRTEKSPVESNGTALRDGVSKQPFPSAGEGSGWSSEPSQVQTATNLQAAQVGQIVVELPTVEGLDRSDFRAVSLSQATQQSTRTPLPELRRAKTAPARDERVIPDSQDIESQTVAVPSASEGSGNVRQTCSALPSHQQDPGFAGAGSPGNLNISTNSVPNVIISHELNLSRPTSAGPSQVLIHNTSPVFRSQLELGWDVAATTSSAKPSQNSIIPNSRQQETTSSAPERPFSQHTHITDRASTPRDSQAAQRVELLASHPETISQSEPESAVPEEDRPLDESLADQGQQEESVPSQQSRPVTPCTMDDASASATPGSLRDKLRLLREEHFGAPLVGATSPATTPGPVGVAPQFFHSSAPQTEARMEAQLNIETTPVGPDSSAPVFTSALAFPAAGEALHSQSVLSSESAHSPSTDLAPMHVFNRPRMEEPATLNPSTLSLSIENEVDVSPSVPTDDGITSLLHPRSSNTDEEDAYVYVPTGASEYLLTLPFQNSIRPQYNDIIRENEVLIHEYNACFRTYPHQTPRPALVDKLDIMFARLFDICDYPPFLDTMPPMSSEQISKHTIGTNPKYAFLSEFLEQLRAVNSDKKVLVLARPGKSLDLLDQLIRSRGTRYVRSGREVVSAADADNALSVALCSTSDEEDTIPKDCDVVIAFDHTFRQELVVPPSHARPQTLLVLVTTASIQHLNMRIPENLQMLERKNQLMLALVKAMHLVEDPGPDSGPSPPAIAEKFVGRVQSPDDDDFYWEPMQLPDAIFSDMYASGSQAYSTQFTPRIENDQIPGSRKRSYVDDDSEPSLQKRPKMAQPQVVATLSQVSDSVRKLVGDDFLPGPEKGTAVVSIDKLEALAAKFIALQKSVEESKAREHKFRQLSDRAQAEVKSHVASINKTQRLYMIALKDRGAFAAECKAAKAEAAALSTNLESSQAQVTTLKAAQAELEKKLAEANSALQGSSNPDLVKMAKMEKELNEAKTEVGRLEKRVVVTQSDYEYTKDLYSKASKRATELASENRTYEKQIEGLRCKADENILRINQVQARQAAQALALEVSDSKNQLRDREAELTRAREELRTLKTGRRETRQSSVPHSPRPSSLGVMSPRNGTRVPSAMGGPSSSRGTSPAPQTGSFDGPAGPGATVPTPSAFNQGPGGGRLSHLRDQRF